MLALAWVSGVDLLLLSVAASAIEVSDCGRSMMKLGMLGP